MKFKNNIGSLYKKFCDNTCSKKEIGELFERIGVGDKKNYERIRSSQISGLKSSGLGDDYLADIIMLTERAVKVKDEDPDLYEQLLKEVAKIKETKELNQRADLAKEKPLWTASKEKTRKKMRKDGVR